MTVLLSPYFGEFGGVYAPQIPMPALRQLEETSVSAQKDSEFQARFSDLLKNYAGCPTVLTRCQDVTTGTNATLHLRREDLLHGGARKTSQMLGRALLTKQMGKIEIIAGTGAGQHGVVLALASALLGLKCRTHMGVKDVERQSLNVFHIRLMGVKVIPAHSGSAVLKDTCNEALHDWLGSYEAVRYILGITAGPHPYPIIVHEFQRMIDEEAKAQTLEGKGRLSDVVIACVGGGLGAIGMSADFINEANVGLTGVEPSDHGTETGEHGAPLRHGRMGIYFGTKTLVIQTEDGQIGKSYSISAGLDFPSVGPQHTYPNSAGRTDYVSITDDKVFEAPRTLCLHEGIIPALESFHALVHALKMMRENSDKEQLPVANLSGRGDRDIFTAYDILKARGEI